MEEMEGVRQDEERVEMDRGYRVGQVNLSISSNNTEMMSCRVEEMVLFCFVGQGR
jgi:hypothetical protein